jgi:hypothetical protein
MGVHFLVEALVIGGITAVVGFVISTLLMYASAPDFSLRRYKFWPYVVIAFFLTGFLMHVGFELIQINKWYCKQGYACRGRD